MFVSDATNKHMGIDSYLDMINVLSPSVSSSCLSAKAKEGEGMSRHKSLS